MVKILTTPTEDEIELALAICENLSGYTEQQLITPILKGIPLVDYYFNDIKKEYWFYFGNILNLSGEQAVVMMVAIEDLIANNDDNINVKELTQEELIEEGYIS